MLEKPNYTINTLRELSLQNPEKKFILLIGEDNLTTFNKWKNYQDVLNNIRNIYLERKELFKRINKDNNR